MRLRGAARRTDRRLQPVDALALALVALASLSCWEPTVVLTELLSDPKLPQHLAAMFLDLPLLTAHPGFWERTGKLRAKVIARRHRARLADSLIAQSCIDHNVRLVTRDADFRHYSRLGGLRLAL